MPTVAATMDKVARKCSVKKPSSWVSVTDDTRLELLDFLDDTVEDLLDRVDWPSPIGIEQTITGTGATTYNLDSQFKRLMRDRWAQLETSNTRRTAVPIKQDGVFAYLGEVGSAGAFRYFRTAGNEEDGYTIEFFQALGTGEEVKVQYVSDYWLKTGTPPTNLSDTWTLDTDTLLIPQKLIELGEVYRFRQRKGLGYNDIYAEYETKLARYHNDSRNARETDFGGIVRAEHPMRVPVPDKIPTS